MDPLPLVRHDGLHFLSEGRAFFFSLYMPMAARSLELSIKVLKYFKVYMTAEPMLYT